MTATRTYKHVNYGQILSAREGDTTHFKVGNYPERFVVEGEPRCDDFLLATEAWEALGEPERIRVTVEAA